MKSLKAMMFILGALFLTLSLGAFAQTYQNSNGCTSWGISGNSRTITSCSTVTQIIRVAKADGTAFDFTLAPNQTVVVGSANVAMTSFGCFEGKRPYIKDTDVEPSYTTDRTTTECRPGVINYNPAARYVKYVPVELLNYGRFNVNAPVTLTAKYINRQEKTDAGSAMTHSVWMGTMPNGDIYQIGIGDYGFAPEANDIAQGFTDAAKGTISSQKTFLVNGLPALATVIEYTLDGKTMRAGQLVIVKGNSAYVFIFRTDMAAPGSDMDALKVFFNSVVIN